MYSYDVDRDGHEAQSLFEVMMSMTAEQWDALGLVDDVDDQRV